MTEISGIKITSAIDNLAKWFAKEMGQKVSVTYDSMWKNENTGRSSFFVWLEDEQGWPYSVYEGSSWTKMVHWMRKEIRRRKILFRKF